MRDALQARAEYLCGIGDHAAALEAFAAAEAKTAGVGPKMDLCFAQIRRAGWGLRVRSCACMIALAGCWGGGLLHCRLGGGPAAAAQPRLDRTCPLPARRRLELSRGDWRRVKALLEAARGLCGKGGDWERKNKLKVGWGRLAGASLRPALICASQASLHLCLFLSR